MYTNLPQGILFIYLLYLIFMHAGKQLKTASYLEVQPVLQGWYYVIHTYMYYIIYHKLRTYNVLYLHTKVTTVFE